MYLKQEIPPIKECTTVHHAVLQVEGLLKRLPRGGKVSKRHRYAANQLSVYLMSRVAMLKLQLYGDVKHDSREGILLLSACSQKHEIAIQKPIAYKYQASKQQFHAQHEFAFSIQKPTTYKALAYNIAIQYLEA